MNKKAFGELLRYGTTGVTTTLVNLFLYHFLLFLKLDYRIANLIALLVSKVYGYIVNKLFVFQSHCDNTKELIKEISKFIGARGLTGFLDYFGLIFSVEIIGINKIFSKYIIQGVVIVLNYILGKKVVFKKNGRIADKGYNTGNLEKYQTKNPLKRKMVKRLNDKIVMISKELIHTSENKSNILDAGCGEGFIDRLLLDSFSNIEITGLEYTDEAIAIAKKLNPSIEYIQGDICSMPFNHNSFDLVICTEVLEHLNNPEKALSELIRCSKGNILITVPHEPWFCMGNLIVLKNIRRLGNPIDHINHWTKHSFRKFLNVGSSGKSWKIMSSFPWIIVYCVEE